MKTKAGPGKSVTQVLSEFWRQDTTVLRAELNVIALQRTQQRFVWWSVDRFRYGLFKTQAGPCGQRYV
ncbi:hypothetical protein QMN58_31005, partial [Escherichia coli]|nr:hypothetical protein [Escherichia coli]